MTTTIRQVSISRKATSPQQLIEQARAAHVLDWLKRAQANSDVKHGELKSFTRRLPGMVQVNGFGQAMAFYYSKREKLAAYGEVYRLVESWLCDPHDYQKTTGTPIYAAYAGQPSALLMGITKESQQCYRHAQAETQALLRWAKKFAEALVSDEETA